jgi:hypothetical protein
MGPSAPLFAMSDACTRAAYDCSARRSWTSLIAEQVRLKRRQHHAGLERRFGKQLEGSADGAARTIDA